MTEYDARYLYAIQEIPGDTAGDKHRWIQGLSSDQRQASGDLDQVPSELLPLVRVNKAIKKKIHEDVAWALKFDDETIVNRALQASWFFDGSHKQVVNDEYFRERIFPYVSLKTRSYVVKALAFGLTGRDPHFAQQIFMTVKSIYGIQQALPLLVACDKNFIYQTIIDDKIKLPYKIAERIFRRSPDFIVRYLRLSKSCDYDPFKENIWTYAGLLSKLLKKRLEDFVELYEICELQKRKPPQMNLSNTRAKILLGRGLDYLIKKPQLYIDILPLKMISQTQIESILPGLLPELFSDYSTNSVMEYLKYYPEEKKFHLLCETYRKKYKKELLDSRDNVTPALMRLLPAEERIKQAEIKIEWEKKQDTHEKNIMLYKTTWICYLPIKQCIPIIKEEISKSSKKEDRLGLIWQIIYACKVNKDDEALLDNLLYFKTRHKNEEYWVFERTMDQVLELYDVPRLSEKILAVLSDIIRMSYVKHGCASESMLIAMAHYKLLHGMPITEVVEMFLETQNKQSYIHFDRMLTEYPQYNRQCLVVCIDIIREKYNTATWEDNKKTFLYNIVEAMYEFNDRCKKSRTAIERLTIKDYPWLMDTVKRILWDLSDRWFYYNYLKNTLNNNEPELYRDWYPKQTSSVVDAKDITSGAALGTLKRDPQHVLNHWQEYLEACKKNYFSKTVQRFVRSTRWYKDIPIRFMERCALDLKEANDNSSSLAILAMLLHGKSLTKLLDPLMPKEISINTDRSNSRGDYNLVSSLPFIMRLSNPPVPLDLVGRLCEGDYLSVALMSLTNLSRRTALPKVISFARDLADQRISVRKHGIRIMSMVASKRELIDFLLFAWQNECHYSIRGVLLEKAQELFVAEQDSDTWSLFSSFILSFTLQDEVWFPNLIESPPLSDTYNVKYIELLFDTIDDFATNGLDIRKTREYTILVLRKIFGSACNLLPEAFTEKLLRRYLFHEDDDISEVMRNFTVNSYLSQTQNKIVANMKIFSDVFVSEVKSRWNVPHPKKSRYYPVNHAVHMLVKDLVANFLSTKSIDSQVISKMLNIFLSVLTPQMDPRSYLMLIYAKQWNVAKRSPTIYGYILAEEIPQLVETFSPLFVPFMADTLNQFLQFYHEHKYMQQIKLNVMKGLVKADTTQSCFMAVTMLSPKESVIFDELIEDFRKMDHPAIKSILNDILNESSYTNVSFDE